MDCSSDDFPAAHSMDTAWFAIDEAGRVAIFDSGEDGAVPHQTVSLGGAGDPDLEADQIFQLLAPDSDEGIWTDGGPFFRYRNIDYGDPGHYVRTDHTPAQPATVAPLPPQLRDKMLRLPVDFTTAASLHLADFMSDGEADTWAETTLRGQPLASSHQPSQPEAKRSGVGWWALIIVVLAAALLALAAR